MNVYLIEDNREKHVLLRSVLECSNSIVGGDVFQDGFNGNGAEAWQCEFALEKALADTSGVLLIDIHLPHTQAARITTHLLSCYAMHANSIQSDYTTLMTKYGNDPDRQIASCLLAISRGVKLRCLITSTDQRAVDGDQTARELAKDAFTGEFRSSGFPEPLDADDADDPARLEEFEKGVTRIATALVTESKRDSYSRAESAWARVDKRLNSGPWPNHPTASSSRLFSGHPWHTAKEWLAALEAGNSEIVTSRAQETANEARQTLHEFLRTLDPEFLGELAPAEVIIILRAAYQETRTHQHISLALIRNLLRVETELNPFQCVAIPATHASKVGCFLQALWALATSRDNDTGDCFNVSLSPTTDHATITFAAHIADDSKAQSCMERLNGHTGRFGTAANAVKQLRTCGGVLIQRQDHAVHIVLEFKLGAVE